MPSRGALANARSLAVLAGHLVSKQHEKKLVSKDTWQKMHQNPTVGYPLGGMATFFTQVNEEKVGPLF